MKSSKFYVYFEVDEANFGRVFAALKPIGVENLKFDLVGATKQIAAPGKVTMIPRGTVNGQLPRGESTRLTLAYLTQHKHAKSKDIVAYLVEHGVAKHTAQGVPSRLKFDGKLKRVKGGMYALDQGAA